MSLYNAIALTALASLAPAHAPAQSKLSATAFVLAQHAPQAAAGQPVTPEERMRRRFPHPVRAGDLVGLRVLDYNDLTIGIVRHVVRSPEGKILLVVAHTGPLGWRGRLVTVPIEAVAIFGRQLASLDMAPEEYASAATWNETAAQVLPHDEKILIGLTRR